MRQSVQTFSAAMLDHSRTSHELDIILNHNPDGEAWEPGERRTLERLKLAIKYGQKGVSAANNARLVSCRVKTHQTQTPAFQFVAHPNVQQLLGSIWYDGLPGFRRKGMVAQLIEVAKLGGMFPIYSSFYMMAPNSERGQFVTKPFVKFICHSSSYAFFLSKFFNKTQFGIGQ
jgi:transient receptor potential cation channel subfamily C member 4